MVRLLMFVFFVILIDGIAYAQQCGGPNCSLQNAQSRIIMQRTVDQLPPLRRLEQSNLEAIDAKLRQLEQRLEQQLQQPMQQPQQRSPAPAFPAPDETSMMAFLRSIKQDVAMHKSTFINMARR